MRHALRIEQRPLPVLLDPLHEQVGDPVGDVEVVRAAGVVAGVVAQLEEVLDVGVPRLEVDARRTLAAAALVDRGDRRVERAQPRHDAVGQAVGAGDQAALGPHPVPGDADAAGELRQLGDVGVALVDALEAVLRRIEQVAARHLRVRGAGVEQRRARREVGERRHQVVELHRRVDVAGAVGFGHEAARDAQEEVLRRLDHLAPLGVAQEVAVVHGAQTEELEGAVAVGVDRGVERRGVGLDEGEHVVGDEPGLVADLDRLGEPRDVLVAHLLVDDRGEQARRQLGVAGLLDDEAGGRADRQVVELPVLAPSASAEMVRVATRIGSTPSRPSDARAMALTILLTSTGSSAPLRLRTRMPPDTGAALPPAWALAGGVLDVSVSVGAAGASCSSARRSRRRGIVARVRGGIPHIAVDQCHQMLPVARSFVRAPAQMPDVPARLVLRCCRSQPPHRVVKSGPDPHISW